MRVSLKKCSLMSTIFFAFFLQACGAGGANSSSVSFYDGDEVCVEDGGSVQAGIPAEYYEFQQDGTPYQAAGFKPQVTKSDCFPRALAAAAGTTAAYDEGLTGGVGLPESINSNGFEFTKLPTGTVPENGNVIAFQDGSTGPDAGHAAVVVGKDDEGFVIVATGYGGGQEYHGVQPDDIYGTYIYGTPAH